jgi:hypothetical protein
MTYSGLDKKGVLICNKTIIDGHEDLKPFVLPYYQGCVERIIMTEAQKKIGIENIEIHTLVAKHSDPNAIGFRFFTPDFVISYSSDTEFSSELIREYEKSDILILNVKEPMGEKEKYHLNSDDAIKILKKVQPRLAIITHFGKKMINANPLLEAREIQRQTGVQTLAATDGLTLNPLNYAAQSRQKTLNLFEKEKEKVSKASEEDSEEKKEVSEQQEPEERIEGKQATLSQSE